MIAALGGEMITYLPAGGVPKTFLALIERQPSQVQQSQGGPYAVDTLEVYIARDATDGVTSIQPRKDKMTFKKNLSDADPSDFTVQKILQEDVGVTATDGGMFHVQVQR